MDWSVQIASFLGLLNFSTLPAGTSPLTSDLTRVKTSTAKKYLNFTKFSGVEI